MVEKVEKIWLDGSLVPWDQAQVHLLTHSLHYGLGVFEGIRAYGSGSDSDTETGSGTGRAAIFRLEEHIKRLFQSAHIMTLEIPWSEAEVRDACIELLRVNKLDACYIRPIVFLDDGAMGIGASTNKVRLGIAAWRWGAYLGEEGLAKGIRVKVSSFQRPGVNATMAKAKVTGAYVNSILARREANALGFDEALLLDDRGYACEGTGENLFICHGNRIVTPPLGGSILAGITRDTILSLCADLGFEVEQRAICRDELYIADEVFLCGTAAEVTPVREIDHRKIGVGARGPVAKALQEAFFKVVSSQNPKYSHWLTAI